MKKYLIALFIASFIAIPALSFAEVTDIDPISSSSECVNIVNSLRYRDRDINKNGEVSTLQDFLQVQGYLNSEPTGYFGMLTLKAVKDFQKANGINPTGYVGPITKEKIKLISCGDVALDLVCCEMFGLGSEMVRTPSTYKMTSKSQCIAEEGLVGGGRNIVANSFCAISSTEPVISSVSGPQTLNVNQSGTWKVSATNLNGGNLSYSVDWGDIESRTSCSDSTAPCSASKEKQLFQQSATFTHAYSTSGIYSPTFTVTNASGKTAKTSLSVKVGDTLISQNLSYSVATDKLVYKQNEKIQITINARNNSATTKTLNWNTGCQVGYIIGNYNTSSNLSCTQALTSINIPPYTTNVWKIEHNPQNLDYKLPVGTHVLTGKVLGYGQANTRISIVSDDVTSVTVLSPNGGETFRMGDSKKITWKDSVITTQVSPTYYDITLMPVASIYPPCVSNEDGIVCHTSLALPPYPYKIAQNILGSSYDWRVGDYIRSGSTLNISDGNYQIRICRTGTSVCDLSDNYFKIDSTTSSNTGVTVLSPNGGENFRTGNNQLISWKDNIITAQSSPAYYNIILVPVMTIYPCLNTPCALNDQLPSYKIAQRVLGSSYDWKVGDYIRSGSTLNIPGGKYRIEVCRDGATACDYSDTYFTIDYNSI